MPSQPCFRPLENSYRSQQPMHTLFRLLNRPWPFYMATALVLVIKHSPSWVLPFLIARVINTLHDPAAFPAYRLWIYFAAVLALIIQNVPMHTLYVSMVSRAVRELEKNLRSALVNRLQQLSMAFHDRTESGRLQAKLLRDVEQVQTFCMLLGDAGALSVFSFVFAVVVTAVKEPRLLVFFVLMTPLVALLRLFFRRHMIERNSAFRSEIEQMSSDVAEMLNMIPVARAHGLEEEATFRMVLVQSPQQRI